MKRQAPRLYDGSDNLSLHECAGNRCRVEKVPVRSIYGGLLEADRKIDRTLNISGELRRGVESTDWACGETLDSPPQRDTRI
jgi:hypothetical protein